MKILRTIVGASAFLVLAACGEGGGGAELTGAFTPDFPPSANRIDMALSDQMIQFKPGYKVEITNGRGRKLWDYSVRGKTIRMTHSDGSSRDDYTIASNGCLIYRENDAVLKLSYCPL